jgi:hypothetical protein
VPVFVSGYSIVYLSRITSLFRFSVDSGHNLLVQWTDTHRIFEVCRQDWGAVGVRLRLEKNVWRTSASSGGGMLDEKIAIIGAPYSIVLDWGYGTKEARREPGYLGREHRLWEF